MAYFRVDEKVYLPELKQSGIIKVINPEEKEATVSYFAGKNEDGKPIFKEVNIKFWNISKFKKRDEIIFAKVKPNAIIPSKIYENGCYDIYACFEENYIEILPGQIKMIPTGIASAFSPKYRASLRERGSSGSKGLAKRCGEIDSGYRDEWFVAINNTTNKSIIIGKQGFEGEAGTVISNLDYIVYPYEKAIAQVALEYVPNVIVKETTYDKLKEITSERGMGKLGSSGK